MYNVGTSLCRFLTVNISKYNKISYMSNINNWNGVSVVKWSKIYLDFKRFWLRLVCDTPYNSYFTAMIFISLHKYLLRHLLDSSKWLSLIYRFLVTLSTRDLERVTFTKYRKITRTHTVVKKLVIKWILFTEINLMNKANICKMKSTSSLKYELKGASHTNFSVSKKETWPYRRIRISLLHSAYYFGV